ncbi:MAG: hypothetical protein V4539_25210 [Bacteroidota bacterium]
MKKAIYFFTFLFLSISYSSSAQQPVNTKGMTYILMPKPNSIIYHDSVFAGSRQFRDLFYRTNDAELISYYKKHQSNKITGQIIGFVGTIVMVVGINDIQSINHKGLGWALAGGGFASTLFGGYLSFKGQQNLQTAVTLFNQKYHRAALGIGTAKNTVGLVYNF